MRLIAKYAAFRNRPTLPNDPLQPPAFETLIAAKANIETLQAKATHVLNLTDNLANFTQRQGYNLKLRSLSDL